jgi:hypothetical protein
MGIEMEGTREALETGAGYNSAHDPTSILIDVYLQGYNFQHVG